MRVYTHFPIVLCLALWHQTVAVHGAGSGGNPGFVDFYGVLGVEFGATSKEVKQRYRQLAKENHPDLVPAGGSDGEVRKREAAERMAGINAAYTTLNDADLRASYDRLYLKVNWWAGSGRRNAGAGTGWPANVGASTAGAPAWVVAYAACPAYVEFTYGSHLLSVVVCNAVWVAHLVLAVACYLLHNRIRWGSPVVTGGIFSHIFWRVLAGMIFALAAGLPVIAAIVGVLYLDAVVVTLLPAAAYTASAFVARSALPSSSFTTLLWLPMKILMAVLGSLDTKPESVVTHYGRVHCSRAEAASLRAAEEERRRKLQERRRQEEAQTLQWRSSVGLGSPMLHTLALTPRSVPPTPARDSGRHLGTPHFHPTTSLRT